MVGRKLLERAGEQPEVLVALACSDVQQVVRRQALEPRAARASASSRSAASITQKPPICSLASLYGPSVVTGSFPVPSTTVAVFGECRPPANTQLPLVRSSSLNAPVAAYAASRSAGSG